MPALSWLEDLIGGVSEDVDELSQRVSRLEESDDNHSGGFLVIFWGKASDSEPPTFSDDIPDSYQQGNDYTATWGY